MRAGLILKKRDLKVSIYLATGLETGKAIFNAYFAKGQVNIATRKRVMMRRLAKLVEADIIRTGVSPLIHGTLYYLSPKGAQFVASRTSWPLEGIWINFNSATAEHDLLCSRVAKLIVKEANEDGRYELNYLMIETELKSGAKLKKGVYFEDIIFGIQVQRNKIQFSLEGDCGTVSRKDFLGKIGYFSNTILVLTTTLERLNLLQQYLKQEGVSKHVYLATFDHFFNKGLLHCEWHTNFSDALITLPI